MNRKLTPEDRQRRLEEKIQMGKLTGQWHIKAVAALLKCSVTKIEDDIRKGRIVVSADRNADGSYKAKGRHIKTEHLRAYLKALYGNAPILNELQP